MMRPHSPVSYRSRGLVVLLLSLTLVGCATTSAPANSGRNVRSGNDEARNAAERNVQMGRAYMQRGQLETALEKLDRALQLDPRSTDAHTVIAVLYERIERPDRAETHYRRAVELAPAEGAVNNNYGQFLCRLGRFEEADRLFLRAIDDPFNKTPGVALLNAGLCAAQAGRLDAADGYLRKVVQLEPANAAALYDLARVSHRRGDHMSARAFIQRYESRAGSMAPEALELAVQIEEALGDSAAARGYRDRLQREFPDYRPAAAGTAIQPRGERSKP